MTDKKVIKRDVWYSLKGFTDARIALGRAGGSLRTKDWLDFKLDHAKARDAVHREFDSGALEAGLIADGEAALVLSSQVSDRAAYLRRPDFGRRLNASSKEILEKHSEHPDLVVVISDGLSATAVHAHARALLSILLPRLREASWSVSPIAIVRFGRVAIEDEVGELLGAKLALILIGERPGLGSSDSMGAYLVHHPRVGKTDAERNCVSNIRPNGLTYDKAADTIFYLLNEARRRKESGVVLKDDRVGIAAQLDLDQNKD